MSKKKHKTPRRPTPGRAVYIPRLRSNPEAKKLTALLAALGWPLDVPHGRAGASARLQAAIRHANPVASDEGRSTKEGATFEEFSDNSKAVKT